MCLILMVPIVCLKIYLTILSLFNDQALPLFVMFKVLAKFHSELTLPVICQALHVVLGQL